MKVSVIIATRDRAQVLARCLAEYTNQTHPDIEIIVADNGSKDETLEMLAEHFPDVRVIPFEENIGPLALNAAVELATGEVLWRTDDDAYPALPTTLADAVAVMEAFPDLVAISGEVYEATLNYALLNYYHFPMSPGLPPPDGYPATGFCGAAGMVRRDAFRAAGGFWDAFYYEEDELSLRMMLRGGRISYVPWVRVVHLNAFAGERNVKNRWRLQFVQAMRFQWKYWPALAAWYRSSVVVVAMMLTAVYHRLPIGFVYATGKEASRAAYRTRKNERVHATLRDLKRLTRGRTIWYVMFDPYLTQLRRRRTTQ